MQLPFDFLAVNMAILTTHDGVYKLVDSVISVRRGQVPDAENSEPRILLSHKS